MIVVTMKEGDELVVVATEEEEEEVVFEVQVNATLRSETSHQQQQPRT